MKMLLAIAAVLLASSAAQAQYTFEYGGRTIRVDPDRGTVSIPGVYDNSGKKSKKPRGDQDSDHPHKPVPQEANTEPQTPAPAVAAPAPVPAQQTPPVTAIAPAKPAAAPVVATAPPVAPPVQQAPRDPNSPLGLWLTEEKEGKVRIEQC